MATPVWLHKAMAKADADGLCLVIFFFACSCDDRVCSSPQRVLKRHSSQLLQRDVAFGLYEFGKNIMYVNITNTDEHVAVMDCVYIPN